MSKLDEIAGMIEVEENELGTFIDVSQLDTSIDKKTNTQLESEEENLIEIEDDFFQKDDEGDNNTPQIFTNDKKPEERVDDTEEENSFLAFSALLKDKGVLPDVDEKDIATVNSADHIVELLNKQLSIVNKTWQDNYKQNLLQNLVKDGYITEAQAEKQLPKLPELDAVSSDEESAKKVIYSYYKEKDIPDAQIENIIGNTIDLIDEAKRLYPYLEEIKDSKQKKIAEELQKKEEAELTQKQQFEKSLKDNVFNYKEFIPGRPLRDADKEAVFNNIVPVLNKINSNLAKYAPVIAYLDKYNFLEGDMSKIFNEIGSKQVSTFEKIISSKKKYGSAGTYVADDEGPKRGSNSGAYNIYK